ncbi:MAG: flagellar motor switch protein FliG [Myxococcales bacterium]|nr:flagellar motor switch protein FliG [Myxococcales bacterium]
MPEDEPKGAQKAAILLLAMGEEAAVNVLGQLKEGEVSRIGLAASTLGDLPPDTAETVLDEFSELVSNELTMKDSNDYVYRLSVRAFGEEKAVRLLREPDLQAVFRERLARTDPVALAGILSKEQPQTVATVLNTVGIEKAGHVLVHLERDTRQNIILRMATLDQVSPEVLSEIYGVLSEELGDYAASQMDGKEYVANVLINMGKDDRDELLAAISDADVELGEEIRKQMFTFEDLLKMSPRDMQRLNRDVDNQTLMLSLKTSTEQMRQHWYKGMSQRAAAMMQEELENMGPARLKDVEEAQGKIVNIAMSLGESGEIDLGGEEMV